MATESMFILDKTFSIFLWNRTFDPNVRSEHSTVVLSFIITSFQLVLQLATNCSIHSGNQHFNSKLNGARMFSEVFSEKGRKQWVDRRGKMKWRVRICF